MRNKIAVLLLGALFVAGLSACDSSATEKVNAGSGASTRNQDMQQILRGGKIFQQNCATCHGKLAHVWKIDRQHGRE